MEKILIVDDEQTLLETLEYNIKKLGYEVVSANDGLTALDLARSQHPDLIILDIMLPGMDGFEVCRIIRQEMNTPILMLTARDDEIDRVVGLEVGADDYLTKPFSMRELMARLKAMLRRVRLIREEAHEETPSSQQPILSFGSLHIDQSRHEVRIEERPIPLKPKEYEMLVYLAQNKGRVLTREHLLEHVWGWDYFGESRTVDVHVRWLRKKIEPDPANPSRIITVRGTGYRFEG